jgi:hypothetical protein
MFDFLLTDVGFKILADFVDDISSDSDELS